MIDFAEQKYGTSSLLYEGFGMRWRTIALAGLVGVGLVIFLSPAPRGIIEGRGIRDLKPSELEEVRQWIAQTQCWTDDFNRKFAAAGAMHGVKSSNTDQVKKMRELLAETERYATDRDWGVVPKLSEDIGMPEDLQRRISADQHASPIELQRNPFQWAPNDSVNIVDH